MGSWLGRCLLLPLVILAFSGYPCRDLSAKESSPDEIRTLLQRGVEKGLNLDDRGAVAELMKAVELAPDNPIGYAYLAMADLFFYETSIDEKEKKKYETSMLKAVEDAEARAEKKIEKDPGNGEACFSMAVARMVKNRYEILRKNYFRAFREAQGVWDLLEKARQLDPQNFDVYYPMGVLHYHLAQLTGVARWVTSVFITSGDRERGLKEFQTAYAKGRLMKDLAASNLVSAYSTYEKKPALALRLALKLKEQYPNNYNFNFALANILSDLGRFDEALSCVREVEEGIRAGMPPYRPELQPRCDQALGKIALDRGEYDKAVGLFQQVLKDTTPGNVRVRAWAMVRLGMIQDARKERKTAEEYYRKALDLEGAEGAAQRAAREYLEVPYSPPTRK
jgi:tetratricopeptide (TPR) repeat protein